MFSLTVRDHLMVAHSLTGEVFGPARRLHGATYLVDLTLRGDHLDEHGVLADIEAVRGELHTAVSALTMRNLDEEPVFAGTNTTTEVLAKHLADVLARRIRDGALGPADAVSAVLVTLHESHVAWASYERAL